MQTLPDTRISADACTTLEPPPPLQDLLVTMARYGRPRISLMDDGCWFCTVTMNTNTEGAKFEIASDFCKHKSATAAAVECLERVRTAVMTIGSAA